MKRQGPRGGLQTDLSATIHAFYASAIGSESYSEALATLGHALGGCAVGMSLQPQPAPIWLSDSIFDPHRTRLMAQQYFDVATNPMVAVMSDLSACEVRPRQTVIEDGSYFASGLYNDIFKPQELVHAAVACGYRSGERFAPVGIFRRPRRDEFGRDEFGLLACVLPHLARSIEIYLRIGTLLDRQRQFDFALNALNFGVAFLDHKEDVWKANALAEAIFREKDGLTVRNGKLSAASHSENAVLEAGIRRARSHVREHAGYRALRVSRPSQRRAYSVLVMPLPAGRDGGEIKAGAIVFITDPEARSRPSPELIGRIFDLTKSQATLLSQLAAGLSLGEAAAAMGIRTQTAKSHLKAAFQRTNTHRQSDLVRLVMQSPAALRPGEKD